MNSILAISGFGDFVGRIDLPMPELGRGTQFLEASADELQAKIRSKVPKQYRSSVVVRPFKRRGSTGLSVEYEDIIEAEVMAAIESRFG
ncbi:MAG: hypothetical protein IH630_04185 [Thermoplasmata archaeon]|nr:hypothetical protein [Thermoplasmata archaeon]